MLEEVEKAIPYMNFKFGRDDNSIASEGTYFFGSFNTQTSNVNLTKNQKPKSYGHGA